MTLAEFNAMLDGVAGLTGKVVFNAFATENKPDPPYCVYQYIADRNFAADGIVYFSAQRLRVDLFMPTKDETLETALEAAFTDNHIYYSKEASYDSDNRLFIISYIVEV